MTLLRRWLPGTLLALAVVALVLGAASVPHVHVGPDPGLWNHDHDLSLLATRGGGAPLPDPAPLLGAVLVVAAIQLLPCARCLSAPRRPFASRAPPLR